MFGKNKKKKTSFIDRLTGSVHVDDLEDDLELFEDDEYEEQPAHHENDDFESLEIDDPSAGQLAVDVYNNEDNIVIKAMIAGVQPNDIDIDISRDMITISGERHEESEIQEKDYYHKELYWGAFTRKILLPEEVDFENADAKEKNGLLTIVLPKVDKHKQTKLHVKSK